MNVFPEEDVLSEGIQMFFFRSNMMNKESTFKGFKYSTGTERQGQVSTVSQTQIFLSLIDDISEKGKS